MRKITLLVLLAVLAPLASACSRTTAAVATAGAAAAAVIGYNDRGATTSVDVSVASLATATERAFQDLSVRLTERKNEDDGIELQGTDGDWKYVVDIEYDDDNRSHSDVEVSVSRDQVNYDKSRAEQMLRRIMMRAGR